MSLLLAGSISLDSTFKFGVIWLHVHSCTHRLRPRNTPTPVFLISSQNGPLRAPRTTHRSFADPLGDINDIQRKSREKS
jgi:hypothetical protein